MAVKFTKLDYGQTKHILAIPDHYVAIAIRIPKASAAGGVVVSENGRLIVKAGTVYPSNDNKAEGIILQDYDVTDGDVTAALLKHAFLRGDRLPAALEAAAQTALPMICVIPAVGSGDADDGDGD